MHSFWEWSLSLSHIHTQTPDSKGTTIRSSINVQLASLLCVCVRASEKEREILTEKRKKKTNQPAEGGASQGSGQNLFTAGPEATFLIWELSKCPSKPPASVRAGAKTQGLYNSRAQAIPAINITHYSPIADVTPDLQTPSLFFFSFLAVFSAYSTALISYRSLFLWSLDYFYLQPPSMGTAAWKRQPCITFTLLRDKPEKMMVAHPRGVLLTVICTAHRGSGLECTYFRLVDQAAWESASTGSPKQTDNSV